MCVFFLTFPNVSEQVVKYSKFGRNFIFLDLSCKENGDILAVKTFVNSVNIHMVQFCVTKKTESRVGTVLIGIYAVSLSGDAV